MRAVAAGVCLALAITACASSEGSLTEYVEDIEVVFQDARGKYEEFLTTPGAGVLIAEGADLLEYTPQQLHVALEQLADIQTEALATAEGIEPPTLVAELHDLFFRELPIAELAVAAESAADWYELSATPEMEAYRTALAGDQVICADFQAALDATEERGDFADTPWLPSEMTEIVNVSLACDALPQNPTDAFRPPVPAP